MSNNHIESVMYKQLHDTIRNKLVILMIFMYPILAFVFYFLLRDIPQAVNMVVPIFVTMHIIMSPIVCMSSVISEEKEKNTLKGLFFSGVRSYEYLIGVSSVLIIIFIVSLIPYLFILQFSLGQIMSFFYFSIIGFVCSMILGSVIGIISKNQMCVGTISSPLSMFIGLLPMASMFNSDIDKFSKILYSKRIYDVIYSFMDNKEIDIFIETSVCIINILILIVIFCFAYKSSRKMHE